MLKCLFYAVESLFQTTEVFQDENAFSKKSGKAVPAGGAFSVFVDEPARQAKQPAVRQPLKTLEVGKLSEAVTAVPSDSKLPLPQLPSSPDVICLEESTGKQRSDGQLLSELSKKNEFRTTNK